jgi:hypothetical protein
VFSGVFMEYFWGLGYKTGLPNDWVKFFSSLFGLGLR